MTCRHLHAADLAEGILADAAQVALDKVAERRATFSRANVLAEVHRQLHGVCFAAPDERIAVAERTAEPRTQSLATDLCTRAPCHARAAAQDRWLQPLPGQGP